jgi:hypothetical protein
MGTMLAAVAQMRWAARATDMDGVVFALPHLDVMTSIDGGWNNISREAIPLLYENPASIWVGFQDPSLPLLPIVEKLFNKRYVIEERYRNLETAPPSPPVAVVAAPPPPAIEEAPEPEPKMEEPAVVASSPPPVEEPPAPEPKAEEPALPPDAPPGPTEGTSS